VTETPSDKPESEHLLEIWETLDEASRRTLLARASKLQDEHAARSAVPAVPANETQNLSTPLVITGDIPGNFHRAMIFVDGENLSARYGDALKERNQRSAPDTTYLPGVLVWRSSWQLSSGLPTVVRSYYYTSVRGDAQKISEAEAMLKAARIHAPRVYARGRSGRSKQVDVALSTDMLMHATRQHYDLAVLVTGDADFIPLIRAVQAYGVSVQVWALSNGLSPELPVAADKFINLDPFLLGQQRSS
jgi:uncharacterized LabA/DUF88 family protein